MTACDAAAQKRLFDLAKLAMSFGGVERGPDLFGERSAVLLQPLKTSGVVAR